MKLTYFTSDPTNFGDELNVIMWSELLPDGFLDEDSSELFLGIGSIIWDTLPETVIKHVMGSGYGGYSALPDVKRPDWNVVWVRGPRSAAMLRLDPKLAICDAATLLRATKLPEPAKGLNVGFMPHFESVKRGAWEKVCKLAGVTFLDPREDPVTLLSKIRGLKMVITEAMHGAIVADAMRVPWVPIIPFHPDHRMKWDDWAESLNIPLQRFSLRPSTLLEAYTTMTGLAGKGVHSAKLKDWPLFSAPNAAVAHLAARRMRHIVENVEPQLSKDADIERVTDRALSALQGFVKFRGQLASHQGPRARNIAVAV